jgi:hypothetical protein
VFPTVAVAFSLFPSLPPPDYPYFWELKGTYTPIAMGRAADSPVIRVSAFEPDVRLVPADAAELLKPRTLLTPRPGKRYD